jgi:AcrR family transcriptional regulator
MPGAIGEHLGGMGIAERRAREKDELRQKILDAATELFLKNGYESVTMRGIADRIEYAPSTIYLHFKNKIEIVAAICQETFETLIERLEETENQGLGPIDSLKAGMRCYIQFGLDHPRQYQLVFGDANAAEVSATIESIQLGEQALAFLARALVRCQEAGLFPATDAGADAIVVWSQMHGTTAILINDYGRYEFPWPPREAVIERSIDLIVRGLRG